MLRVRLPFFVGAWLCSLMVATVVGAQTFTVVQPTNQTISHRLGDLHDENNLKGPTEIPHHPVPLQSNSHNGGSSGGGTGTGPDTSLQSTPGPLINGTPITDFDGLSVNQGGYIPSDNNIAVGPNYVMETVNAAYAVYNKSGGLIAGPSSLRSLWTGLGGACSANNGGDTVVQYDRAADRWIMTQLGSLSNPYSECIAVSTSADPTGTYYLYSYSFGSNLNDYPKFGVWSTPTNSAYLATYNLFANGGSFAGPEICAYDRVAMLAGASNPVGLCYTGLNGASFLPSDVDGPTVPLDGTPGYFIDLYTTSSLGVYRLTPNFTTKTAALSAFTTIPVNSFSEAPSAAQPGTGEPLDPLSDRLMYRLAFHMFANHESIVVNHAVTAGSSSGVRWYELQAPVSASGTFSVAQQGTYAPDFNYRWMGSAAMDQSGDIAVGYSVSSSSTYPSVRYSGRLSTDPLNTLESEASIKEGAGSQTGYTRWGDYSSMRIDPSDDCTFWYVNEYLPVSSSYGWYTHIGAFKFTACGQAPTPDFSISANPSSVSIQQGNQGGSTITVTSLNGFNSSVGLSVISGCPSNATCTLSPTSNTPPANGSFNSSLTIATAASTPAGPYTVVVQGSGSSGNHNTSVSLTVTQAPTPDFSVSASPTSVSIQQGNQGGSTITVTSVNGFNSLVTLSVLSGCPSNATCTLNPTSNTPPANGSFTSSLTITTTASTPTGPYTVVVQGSGSSGNRTASVSLTVTAAAADFGLTVSGNLTVSRKSSGSLTVNTSAIGGASSVTLSVSGLPQRTSSSFSVNPVAAGGSSKLTISTTPSTVAGHYNVTVTGKEGTLTHSVSFTLTVQ